MAGSAIGILTPSRLAAVINTGEHVGLVLIGAGMCAWGAVALQTRALGPLSMAPLLIGLVGLSGMTVVSPETFAAVERGCLPLVFAATWILLGLALVTAPAPTRPRRSIG